MHHPFQSLAALPWTLLAMLPLAAALDMLTSSSLDSCQSNSAFSATLFDVTFTPNNGSLQLNINGVSVIDGYATILLTVEAYGYTALQQTLDPCKSDFFVGLCPMNVGSIELQSAFTVPSSALAEIPSIAYTIPDLDAVVQVKFNETSTGQIVACVEAKLSNGKTVYQKGVGWALAVISGIALVASAITSGLGHSNTAAHVAANALSLFGYFQNQAFLGMTVVDLPPIVTAWTQNFQWSMGIIQVEFIQSIATWYQRATGGTPSTIIANLDTTSVDVEKRSLVLRPMHMLHVLKRGFDASVNLLKRTSNTADTVVVRGIERVGFKAGIETSNIFMTGYIFYIIFVFAVVLGVTAFKFAVEGLAKAGKLRPDQFRDFRNGWTVVLKGILYRIVLIGFPQMIVLCLWEFTQDDSAAEVALAAFTIIAMIGLLGWAASKIIRIARRSIAMHNTPTYILYSDPASLNKWGFLYVQFKATAYYFIVPTLVHILLKGMFIALGQGSAITQVVALLILEALMLVGVSVLSPYMDRKTNAFNISICAINLVSAIFLLMFSDVFDQPGLVTGIMGVIFFVYNAVFSTVLLILVLIASIYALVTKNPDVRYEPMRDDRSVFIKSSAQLPTELEMLGAVARGDGKQADSGPDSSRLGDSDDDDIRPGSHWDNSNRTGTLNATPATAEVAPLGLSRPMTNTSQVSGLSYTKVPPSPSPSPSDVPPAYPGQQRGPGGAPASPSPWQQRPASPWQQGQGGRPASPSPFGQQQTGRASPSPFQKQGRPASPSPWPMQNTPQPQPQQQQAPPESPSPWQQHQQRSASPSPWQRGAGYEH